MSGVRLDSRWALFSWPLLLGCMAIVFACLQANQLLRDADTLWHIRSGQWIWMHGAIPTTDFFSHSFFGKPWVSHEWLASLILFLSFDALSWTGVVAATALAFGVAIGLIARFLFQRIEPIRALFVTALVFASLATHLLARPHVMAMPLLAIWVIGCVGAAEERRAPTLWLLPVMVLWANLHGSFIAGLLLAPLLAIEAALQGSRPEKTKVLQHWLTFWVLAVLASLVSPHHVHGLLFPLQLSSMTFATSVIGEWRPADFQQLELQAIWIFGLLLLGWVTKIRVSWPRLAVVIFLAHASLAHTRHLTLLAIVVPPLLATPFRQALSTVDADNSNRLDRFFNQLNRSAHPGVAIAIALIVSGAILAYTGSEIRPPQRTLPEKAVAFLKENFPQGPVLNSYNLGGGLIFSGIPVAIDGRADLYGDAFLKQVHDATRGMPGALAAMIQSLQIGWTFFEPNAPVVQNLDLMPEWERIYKDNDVVIHSRKLPKD